MENEYADEDAPGPNVWTELDDAADNLRAAITQVMEGVPPGVPDIDVDLAVWRFQQARRACAEETYRTLAGE